MTFNKPPEWGKRYVFPANISVGYTCNGATRATGKYVVEMAKKYEDTVVGQIAKEAELAGMASCTVLNKDAILDALDKRTPKTPIRCSLADRSCPACGAYINFDALNDDIGDAPNFCKDCGQALDWSRLTPTYSNLIIGETP